MKKFVKVENVLVNEKSKYHLTIRELYLYTLLKKLQDVTGEVVINVTLLEDYSKIKFSQTNKIAKRYIKDSLLSMHQKGVIKLDKDIKDYNHSITITFKDDFNKSGHEQIPIDKFFSFETMKDLYIYVVVSCFEGLDKFTCSLERWSNILGVHEKTAHKYLKEVIEKELIYVNVGDWYKKDRRELNTYSIHPFTENEKSSQQKKKEKQKMQEQNNDPFKNAEPVNDDGEWGEEPLNKSKWYDWTVFLNVDDFVEYLESEDGELIKQAEKRINALKQSEKGKDLVKNYMKQAKNKIRERESQLKQEQMQQERKNREQWIIGKVNDGNIVVERSGELKLLGNIDEVKVDDVLYYVSNDGYHDYLENVELKEFIKPKIKVYGEYYKYSEHVLDEILDEFKKLYKKYGGMEKRYDIEQDLIKIRDEICERYNENRNIEDDWEGDLWRQGDSGEQDYNTSKLDRMRENEKGAV